MKAQQWLERGSQMQDAMDAFSNFWRGFNNLYFPFEGRHEREKIRNFLRAAMDDSHAEALLSAQNECVTYLLSEPVMDMRGNGRSTEPNITAFQNAASPLAQLEEVFMVIYQVRCNLEHGQKSPSRARDEQLCRAAGPLVAHVLGEHA